MSYSMRKFGMAILMTLLNKGLFITRRIMRPFLEIIRSNSKRSHFPLSILTDSYRFLPILTDSYRIVPIPTAFYRLTPSLPLSDGIWMGYGWDMDGIIDEERLCGVGRVLCLIFKEQSLIKHLQLA